ncbi:MAG: hypothetical protein JSW51_07330 [Gemmatimonadota bacterium]|nr:MAG: hypothetical protein JSW51_07330 [Gemmatimonadota bacterium]
MKQPNGFMLVELVVAMLLLTTVLLVLLANTAMVTRLVRNGDAYSTTAAMAVGRLELWRGVGCDSGGATLELESSNAAWLAQWPAGGAVSSKAISVTTVLSRGVRTDTFWTTGGC